MIAHLAYQFAPVFANYFILHFAKWAAYVHLTLGPGRLI